MRRKQLNVLMVIVTTIGVSATGLAQEPVRQDPLPRSRQGKPSQKPPTEPTEKPILTTPILEPDDAMRRAIANLSTQIGLLTGEMRMFRLETQRNSTMMELLLNEDRLAKVEDKIQETANNKAQLDAREQEIQRRSRNIQAELLARGGLRRDEAEAAIRSDLQRALDDVHNQQAVHQQRMAELTEQATRFRARGEALRKKLELIDLKNEKEEKEEK
jgi:hypothetical protein